jgi:oxygen-independent coproporphyrinogen-3 oxidase
MILVIKGHTYRYEMENICRLFLPHESISTVEQEQEQEHETVAVTCIHQEAGNAVLTASLRLDTWQKTAEERVPAGLADYEKECERRLAVLLYTLFVKLCGYSLRWGAVTGVRPVKLMRRMIEQKGEEGAVRWFREALLVGEEKTALCLETLKRENTMLSLSRPESFSLYLSIPFCPTRCDYCSFVSQTVERAAKLIPDYVKCLCREIEATAQIAATLGLRLETVYMGGGTPTTLSAQQLTTILQAVDRHFDLTHLREYTVEAGRPDTVTEDKLRALKAAGVSRISINPQSLQDAVLMAIGRRHSVRQFYEAFDMARRCGFDNVNTDLIAGLPGDTYEGFCESIEGILGLSPESITVHALAMKRASNLVIHHRAEVQGGQEAVQMVDRSGVRLRESGYHPYYLYRQSRAVGNMENVGWSKPGKEGLYNVYIMDETHTILACGAGAVTKLKQPGTDYIERILNYKFPYENNGRFDQMLKRKEQVNDFYETVYSQADSEAQRNK